MKHDWVALATYHLDEADAGRFLAAEAEGLTIELPVTIDLSKFRMLGIGCFRCEQGGTVALLGTECPGEPARNL